MSYIRRPQSLPIWMSASCVNKRLQFDRNFSEMLPFEKWISRRVFWSGKKEKSFLQQEGGKIVSSIGKKTKQSWPTSLWLQRLHTFSCLSIPWQVSIGRTRRGEAFFRPRQICFQKKWRRREKKVCLFCFRIPTLYLSFRQSVWILKRNESNVHQLGRAAFHICQMQRLRLILGGLRFVSLQFFLYSFLFSYYRSRLHVGRLVLERRKSSW